MAVGLRGAGMVEIALVCAALFAGLLGPAAASAKSGVAGSPHDMRGRTAAEKIEICNFCHIPQENGDRDRQLWAENGVASRGFATFAIPPDGEPIVAKPYGVSLVCLSCHDATIAIDVAASTFARFGRVRPGGLADSHPVSAVFYQDYDPAFNRSSRGRVGDLPLFRASVGKDAVERVECPSCHNPHDIVFGKFLRMSNTDSALCVNCHNK